MSEIKIFLFGPPRVEQDGHPVEIVLRKAVALLAYLVVTNQTQSREALATLFWPDDDHSTALANLRRALYRVNSALDSEGLVVRRNTIERDLQANVWLDTEQFAEYAQACLKDPFEDEPLDPVCLQRLTAALKLYGDGFMAGFTLPDTPDFDEWQFFRAEDYRRSCDEALQQLIHSYRQRKDWKSAITYARRRLALNPLEESAHRYLMELYVQSGQAAAALRQYERCKEILARELDVPPREGTTDLFKAIKNGQIAVPEFSALRLPEGSRLPVSDKGGSRFQTPPASTGHAHSLPALSVPQKSTIPGPPNNLPACAHSFVGRDRELRDVERLLDGASDRRLVTIIGPGGIGKTRLAIEAARNAARSFIGGVYFVPLASLNRDDPIVPTIAEQVGLHFQQDSTSEYQLQNYLREKQILLLLDNTEHLPSAPCLIAKILEQAPSVKILVTSRERLNLTNEALYVLGGLTYPGEGECSDPMRCGAVQLLTQCAQLARPGVSLQDEDLHHMSRICRLVQGMPLAIVLAAGWFELLSFAEIADEIAQNLDFLKGRMRDLPPRQRSVRATFEYSWHRLSVPERQALMQLAVFRTGFTRQAANGVTGADLRVLRKLIDKSLVYFREEGRYGMHELVRQYAAEKLEASSEAQRVQERHSEFYLGWLSRREADLKGNQQAAALNAIEADLENIRVAWRWALQNRNESVIDRAVESLYLFFTFRSRFREGIELFRFSQEAWTPCIEKELSPVCARMLTRLAWLQSMSLPGQHEIEGYLHKSLKVAQAHKDRSEAAFCLLQLGCYHRMVKGDWVTALPYLEQSLERYQQLDDDFYSSIVLHWIGSCYGAAADLPNLIRYCNESLELARRTGNKALMPFNLRALSMGTLGSGDYAATERYCREALVIDAETDMPMGIAESKTLLGLICFLQGHLEQACVLADEGLDLAREVGFPATLGHACALQTLTTAVLGDADQSAQLGTECLATRSTHLGKIVAHWGLSLAHASLGRDDVAWQHTQAVLDIADRVALPAAKTWPLPVVALLLARRGEPLSAVALLSLARHHPSNPTGWLERWAPFVALRDDLRAELGPQAYADASERGQRMDLGTAIAELKQRLQLVRIPG